MNFYGTAAWKKTRLAALKRAKWACSVCSSSVSARGSSRVDHIVSVRQRPDLALAESNLRVLCASCDNKRHSEKGRGGKDLPTIGSDGYPVGSEWS